MTSNNNAISFPSTTAHACACKPKCPHASIILIAQTNTFLTHYMYTIMHNCEGGITAQTLDVRDGKISMSRSFKSPVLRLGLGLWFRLIHQVSIHQRRQVSIHPRFGLRPAQNNCTSNANRPEFLVTLILQHMPR